MLEKKDVLGIKDMSLNDINLILDTAKEMKKILLSGNKKVPHLQGKTVVTLFYENSTRTRMSFEIASKILSSVSANISVATSSVAKGETLIDTGRTLDAMATDILIIRHSMSGSAKLLADNVRASVINAGDGMNEHPTQALLDFFTMREKFGSIKGLNVAICGDVKYSRVARSNIWGLNKLGANVTIFAPNTLLPLGIEKMGVKVAPSIDEAVKNKDVIMGLRIQLERQQSGLFPSVAEYSNFFGVDEKRVEMASNNCIVMHPGPTNRGVELMGDVCDGNQSKINEQVTNGVAVRMAILFLLSRRAL